MRRKRIDGREWFIARVGGNVTLLTDKCTLVQKVTLLEKNALILLKYVFEIICKYRFDE